MRPAIRSLMADMVRAAAPPALLRDAAAGDFDVDPAALAARWEHAVAAAAAVRGYDLDAPPVVPRTPAPLRRLVEREPTPLQREVLAAIRRLLDAGRQVTREDLVTSGLDRQTADEVLRALVDRGLIELWPAPRRRARPVIVLGPRSHLYPERDVRTQRSHAIEALIRQGKTVDEITSDPAISPSATRAEVYRVRGFYCRDLPTHGERGANYHAVVALVNAGATNRSKIGRELGIGPVRVREHITAAERRQEIRR